MKDKLIIAAGLALLLAVVFTCSKYWANPEELPKQSEPTPIVWVNEGGDIVSSLKGDPEAFAQIDKHLTDSLAKVYKTKAKNLHEYVVAIEGASADVQPVPESKAADYFPAKDSCPPQIKNLRQRFQNPYYLADVQIGDSSYMHLQAYDTLTVLWKRVKEGGLFNKRTYLQLDISKANPDVKVYGLKAYRVEEKQKKWSIAVQAGYGFAFDGQEVRRMPYAGIGISRTIIRF